MSAQQAVFYLSQLPSFILTGMLDSGALRTRAALCAELHAEAGQQVPLEKVPCCGRLAEAGNVMRTYWGIPVALWWARVRYRWGHPFCTSPLWGSSWACLQQPRSTPSQNDLVLAQKCSLELWLCSQHCTAGWALGGQTCPAVKLQHGRPAPPCTLLERLVQKQANGAASMAHGDPCAFPSSAEKLQCSVPKDTPVGGFVFFRVFFFTVHTYPRVHRTETLMIILSYCCSVGLAALKT